MDDDKIGGRKGGRKYMEAIVEKGKSKSWRDVFKFIRQQKSIRCCRRTSSRSWAMKTPARGLEQPITLWSRESDSEVYVLDGRNRLDAMELVGMETFYETKEGDYHIRAGHYLGSYEQRRIGIYRISYRSPRTSAVAISPRSSRPI